MDYATTDFYLPCSRNVFAAARKMLITDIFEKLALVRLRTSSKIYTLFNRINYFSQINSGYQNQNIQSSIMKKKLPSLIEIDVSIQNNHFKH